VKLRTEVMCPRIQPEVVSYEHGVFIKLGVLQKAGNFVTTKQTTGFPRPLSCEFSYLGRVGD
jgi:hypothetical protein